MKRSRVAGLAVGLVAVGLGAWFFFGASAKPPLPTARDVAHTTPRAQPPRALPRPIAGAPCRLSGRVENGSAVRVRVRSERAELDLDAMLVEGGRAFAADVPEQGRLHVVALAGDGRSVSASVFCGGDGVAEVLLRLPPVDPSHAVLSGICKYLDTGAPVADALVLAEPASSIGELRAVPGVGFSAVADDAGRFVAGVPPGSYALRCAKDGDEGVPVRVNLESGAKRELTLFVEPRAAIAGVVLGSSGPLGEVLVVARSERGGFDRAPVSERSDADGRFVLRGLAPGPVVVEAQDAGAFAEAHAIARVELPYAEVTLQLAPSVSRIEGRVLSEAGGELAGATVDVETESDRRTTASGTLHRRAVSEEDGSFVVGGLSSGRYRMRVQAPLHADTELSIDVPVGAAYVAITLRRACVAELRVLPAEPVLPVIVQATRRDGPVTEVAGRTGDVLRLEGVSGPAELVARTTGATVRTATAAVTLCAGPVDLVLGGGRKGQGKLHVKVVTKKGEPVSGARIWISMRGRSALSDDAGEARFMDLDPRTYAVGTQGAEPREIEVEADREARVTLTIAREGGEIHGTVEGGGPVEGARVLASCGDTGQPPGMDRASVVARSDAAGAFSFTPDQGGVCLVRAEHATRGRSEPVTLRAGGPQAVLRLLAGGSISGLVRSEDGAPVSPYTLSVKSLGRAEEIESRTVYVTAADGRFRVDDVTPGHVALGVRAAEGRAHRELELGLGAHVTGVELVVFTRGRVTGRVVSAVDRQPLAGARVEVRWPGREWGRVVTDAAGRFGFEVPAGESLNAFASAAGYYPKGSAPFDLVAGGPTDIGDLVLSPRAGPEEKDGGIGIMISGEARGIRVINFVDDSPGREAGMEIGDLITAIDGVPAGREPLMNWVVSLRGPPGTSVILEVERGTRPAFTLVVVRRAIGLPRVPDEAP